MAALPHHTLNDGTTLPAVGLGTYALRGIPGAASMADALRAGYRLLDSAVNYENEGAVGNAVRMSGVPREEIRVTSKLPGRQLLQRLPQQVADQLNFVRCQVRDLLLSPARYPQDLGPRHVDRAAPCLFYGLHPVELLL